MTTFGSRRWLGSVTAGLLVASSSAAGRAAVSVNTEACPELRPALLQDRLALELAAAGPRAPHGDVTVTFKCSQTGVRIDSADGHLLREVPAPDTSDTDKERTIALAAAEALLGTAAASSPTGAAAPAAPPRPGASVAVETSNMGWGYGLSAHGWMPVGLHTAIRAGAHVGWAEQKQPGGEVAKAIIPELELAIALRPQVRFPRGWPDTEGRLFVAPAVAILSGLPAADAGQRAWTITTGFGWSTFWRAGHTLIGVDWDFGLIWPRPVSAFDVDHTWLSRLSLRIALFVGFEIAGG